MNIAAKSRTKPVALLAGLTLTLAACGSSGTQTATENPNETPDAASPVGAPTIEKMAYADSVLGSAMEAQNGVSTGKFEVSVTLNAEAVGGVITATGEFDATIDAALLSVDLSGMDTANPGSGDDDLNIDLGNMFAEPMTFLTIGEESYLSGGIANMFGANDGMWLQLDSDMASMASEGMPGDFGSPQDMFEQFKDADLTVTELGTAEYDGVTTTEYEITSDDEEVSALHIWVGEDDLIRHFESTQTSTEAGQTTESVIVGDLFAYGEEVSIVAPTPDQVIEAPSFGD